MSSDLLALQNVVTGLSETNFIEPSAVAAIGLARSWRMKAILLAIASRAPGGPYVYRRVQDLQARRQQNGEQMIERALDLAALYQRGGGTIVGRRFLEIGTGWCPWVPLLLKAAGASRIVTVDVNPWLSYHTAVTTTGAFLDSAGRIAERLQIAPHGIEEALAGAVSARSLEAWLSATGITYVAGKELSAANFPASSFDGVLSSNVLEHVPPRQLVDIHRECERLLCPGGVIAHRFNPQDHFSIDDPSITGANFLRYSERTWKWIGGSGLAYHNRLRCPQHRRLIEDAGLMIEYCRARPDETARRAIEAGRLNVHADFASMTATELTDDYLWVVARKPLGEPGT